LFWTALVSYTGPLSILIGYYLAFSVIKRTPFTPLDLLCFTWVSLIRPPGKPDEGTQFVRLLLPPLAVLQGLHAFPVAGTQALWSALLMIPVGALCIANGVHWIAFRFRGQNVRRDLFAIGAIAAIVVMVFLVNTELRQGLATARRVYARSIPIGLPGTEDVRVFTREQAATYQAIAAAIDENCKSFVMLPGMNSFYFWTRQESPTGYNATGWPTEFDDAHQQRVIEQTRSIDGLCLLENIPLAQFWGAGAGIPPGPLVRYLHRGFVPIAQFGDYRLYKREGGGSGS
jgi:hypothetical protein